ncbi:MAG: hypothetical protein HYW48_07585 [Deltaproteobacteria bacterium]|nr:hypothetical protein [Deltaproteobacteria bacterium]
MRKSFSHTRLYHNIKRRDSIYSTITTQKFRWLLPDAWEDECFAKACEFKLSTHTNFFRTPSFVRKGKHPPSVAANWLLSTEENAALALAELHDYPNHFDTQFLHIFLSDESVFDGTMMEAFSLLVSAIFICGGADIIYLCVNRPKTMRHLELLEWGQTKTQVTPIDCDPLALPTSSPLLPQKVICIWKESWWESKRGEHDRTTLNYLLLRQRKTERQRRDKIVAQKKRRRPSSILLRLFRPRVDDDD